MIVFAVRLHKLYSLQTQGNKFVSLNAPWTELLLHKICCAQPKLTALGLAAQDWVLFLTSILQAGNKLQYLGISTAIPLGVCYTFAGR